MIDHKQKLLEQAAFARKLAAEDLVHAEKRLVEAIKRRDECQERIARFESAYVALEKTSSAEIDRVGEIMDACQWPYTR